MKESICYKIKNDYKKYLEPQIILTRFQKPIRGTSFAREGIEIFFNDWFERNLLKV